MPTTTALAIAAEYTFGRGFSVSEFISETGSLEEIVAEVLWLRKKYLLVFCCRYLQISTFLSLQVLTEKQMDVYHIA